MKCGKVYVSITDDVGENEGGYFCQVYADQDMEHQLDYFCVHSEELTNGTEVENLIEQIVVDEGYDDLAAEYWAKLHQQNKCPVHER